MVFVVDPEENDFECIAVLSGHSQDVKMVKFHPSKEVCLLYYVIVDVRI